jgi:type IV secretory pathway VirJ component
MKKALLLLVLAFSVTPLVAREEVTSFGPFGKITLYFEKPQPSHIAIFVSGDGGWNQGVIDMARQLASLDALVVGIDINHFIKRMEASSQKCLYPAADFEALSKFVQKKLNYPSYRTPVLVGYSSGATLVYAALVQAPASTFRGAISMGFCPDLLTKRPLCKGSGLEWSTAPKGQGFLFSPATTLEVPWIALQGTIDQVCDPTLTENFVKKVPKGQLVLLPKVGHGFSVPRNWVAEFRKAFSDLESRPDVQQGIPNKKVGETDKPPLDLPIIEVPTVSGVNNGMMGILVTGDGGWGVTDRGMANSLAARGIPVVGLNSLHYFWKQRTPEESAVDLEQILKHYALEWNRSKYLVIGYSFGADVLPFMLNRIPARSLENVKVIAFLGLGSTADFEFHITDWIASGPSPTSLRVRPELEKLRGKKMLCFYGTEDDDALCGHLEPGLAKAIPIQGGHRFGSGYQPIVDAILQEAR